MCQQDPALSADPASSLILKKKHKSGFDLWPPGCTLTRPRLCADICDLMAAQSTPGWDRAVQVHGGSHPEAETHLLNLPGSQSGWEVHCLETNPATGAGFPSENCMLLWREEKLRSGPTRWLRLRRGNPILRPGETSPSARQQQLQRFASSSLPHHLSELSLVLSVRLGHAQSMFCNAQGNHILLHIYLPPSLTSLVCVGFCLFVWSLLRPSLGSGLPLSEGLSLRQPLQFHTTDWRIHLSRGERRRGNAKEEGDDREADRRRRRRGGGCFIGKYQNLRKGSGCRNRREGGGLKDLRKVGRLKCWSIVWEKEAEWTTQSINVDLLWLKTSEVSLTENKKARLFNPDRSFHFVLFDLM